MLNWSNVGLFFNKNKSQLDVLCNNFKSKKNHESFIIQNKRSKIFSNKALREILEKEKLKLKSTQIITVANQKGGVGKTSTILSQGRNLSDLGFNVLIVDTDPQANTTQSLMRKKNTPSLLDILNEKISIKNSILTIKENLNLVPATSDCSQIDFLLSDPQFTYNPSTLMRNLVVNLNYDFVLIDTNPSFSSINIACIASSDRVICPVPLANWEIDGVKQVLKVINGINKRLKTNILLDFLITKFQVNETSAYERMNKVRNLKGNLFNTLIPMASDFKQAQDSGELKTKGKAYKATLKLTREIVENSIKN